VTPFEKLTAAIDKLEWLKASADAGNWFTYKHDVLYATDEKRGTVAISKPENAELIVALHAAMPGLLIWMWSEFHRTQIEENVEGIPIHYRNVLHVADLILAAGS
jgi:hypothetical protein